MIKKFMLINSEDAGSKRDKFNVAFVSFIPQNKIAKKKKFHYLIMQKLAKIMIHPLPRTCIIQIEIKKSRKDTYTHYLHRA